MRFQLIVLLAAWAVVGVCCTAGVNQDADAQVEAPKSAVEKSARANFVMPKLFDFEMFKSRYNKHYANAAELLRRTKLFMARAFAVFISAVKYTHRKSSKYLRINPRSDWTEAERDVITGGSIIKSRPDVSSSDDPEHPEPAVNPSDVEQLLAEIVQHKNDNPEFAAIAAELEGGALKRRKRNIDPNTPTRERKLSIDDLIGGPVKPLEVSEKYTPSVPSNNPDYEQLQVFSQGADDDDEDGEQVKPIATDEAQRIDEATLRGGYLDYVMNSLKSAADYLLVPGDKDQASGAKKYKILVDGKDIGEEQFYDSEDNAEKQATNDPDEIFLDYRDTGCFLQPKDQKDCGACYIFTAISVLEYQHCKQTGKLVPFSEQYVVDCGRGRLGLMKGCSGGIEAHVGHFADKYGLELSVDYPYRARELTCPYEPKTDPRHMGHSKFEALEIVEIEEEQYLTPGLVKYLLENKGPLFFSIRTGPDFSDYGGGVDVLRCIRDKPSAHAMTLVGHGIEDGVEYWLIRNSYGLDFGQQGYYKLAKEIPAGCLISVGYARGQFKANKRHRGKGVFGELKKKNLLAQFGPGAH